MKIKMIKCHGSGNDFFLIDESTLDNPLSDNNRKELAICICNRNSQFGSDGVIFVNESKIADAKSRIFNADGSEAELCGNGIRCVGRYFFEKLKKYELKIETIRSVYQLAKEESIFDNIETFSVLIDTVEFDLEKIPIRVHDNKVFGNPIHLFHENYNFYAISLTNPHLISIVEDLSVEDLVIIGSEANNNKEIFPNGINVSFCKILNKEFIQVETYERGVGRTYSCGTAMASSVLICCIEGKLEFNKYINVINEGGMVKCKAEKLENGKVSVSLLGNATFVYETDIEIDLMQLNAPTKFEGTCNLKEIEDYSIFLNYSKELLQKASS